MGYFAEINVSLRSCALCIVARKGRVLFERELAREISNITHCFVEFTRPIERVGLVTEGFDLVGMEARQVNAPLLAMRSKIDKNDARGIAQMLRTDGFSPVDVKRREAHGVRALLSIRKALLMKTMDRANEVLGVLKTLGARLFMAVKHRSFAPQDVDRWH